MAERTFISHISEDARVAARLKSAITRDFLGLVDVFVSSDTESIAAGEDWLTSIDDALRQCTVFMIICSPASITRPWINFEAGAAWMRNIPLIPMCYGGLAPRDLPMPLSIRQGLSIDSADGLRRLYARLAAVLGCKVPDHAIDALAREFANGSASGGSASDTGTEGDTRTRSAHPTR
jgi:hypothetical protein